MSVQAIAFLYLYKKGPKLPSPCKRNLKVHMRQSGNIETNGWIKQGTHNPYALATYTPVSSPGQSSSSTATCQLFLPRQLSSLLNHHMRDPASKTFRSTYPSSSSTNHISTNPTPRRFNNTHSRNTHHTWHSQIHKIFLISINISSIETTDSLDTR